MVSGPCCDISITPIAPNTLYQLFKPCYSDILGNLELFHMVAFCGEPGLGLQELCDCFARYLASIKKTLIVFNGDNMNPEKASSSLVRFSRKTISEADRAFTVVFVNNLPASDERETRRQANAIKRLFDAGFSVVLSVRPESAQLLEVMPFHKVIDFDRACEYLHLCVGSSPSEEECFSLSRGVPGLFLSLLNSGFLVDHVLPLVYIEGLADAVFQSVRPGLPDEDLRFRLFLFLVGSGSLVDVESELGFKVPEMVSELEAQSPLFGVSQRERTFLTLPEQVKLPFDYLFDALRLPIKLHPQAVLRAASFVFGKDAERSISIAKHLEGEYLGRYVLSFGCDLLDLGEFELVENGLQAAKKIEDADHNLCNALTGALNALTERRFQTSFYECVTPEFIDGFSAGNADARAALMFVDMRQRFCGEKREAFGPVRSCKTAEQRLRLHADIFGHILRGEFDEAIKLSIGVPTRRRKPSLSMALLALDSELIRLMTCDSAPKNSEWISQGKAFLSGLRHNIVGDYANLVSGLAQLLRGPFDDPDEIDVAMTWFPEDRVIQGFALIEKAVLHMRHGVWTHAHVESNSAQSLLCGTEACSLENMGRLLSAIARYDLGEFAAILPETYACDMKVIATFISRALDSSSNADSLANQPKSLPRQNIWFLVLLTNGIEGFSMRLEDELYPEWRRALMSARKAVGGPFPKKELAKVVALKPNDGGTPAAPAQIAPPQYAGMEKIRLNLLGEFSLYVGRRRVDNSRLETRYLKPVLAFLALHPQCCVSQSALFEQVWPESTYTAAHDRMYQTNSQFRKVLRPLGFSANPFIMGRATKTIALDPTLVSCDVTDLIQVANAAINEKDDAKTVELAVQTESLYAGDLWVPDNDPTGFMTSMAAKVKKIYTNALVSGAESAYRTGRLRMVIRLAESALHADDMREDAEMLLLRALKESARDREASESYEGFCRNLAEKTRRPPTNDLRELADRLLHLSEKSA